MNWHTWVLFGASGSVSIGHMICALCTRSVDLAPFRMTRGIVILLCPPHRDPTFLTRRGGQDLVERLTGRWAGHGILTRSRRAALDDHLAACEPAADPARPGSYSWPALRNEVEQRFAGGASVAEVRESIHADYADCPATLPSERTIRRWFTERRWLTAGIRRPGRAPRPRLRLPIPRELVQHLDIGVGSLNHAWPIIERRDIGIPPRRRR